MCVGKRESLLVLYKVIVGEELILDTERNCSPYLETIG